MGEEPWSHKKEPQLLLGRPQEAERERKKYPGFSLLPSNVLPGQGSPRTVIPCSTGQARKMVGREQTGI